ncbi:3-dehydroquinate synthase [Kytococcus sp. Marseille-QA3725]
MSSSLQPLPAAVALIGAPGSGKSTVGALLAGDASAALVDTDALVEERAGCTVAELFATRGEAAFRELEADAVADALRGTDLPVDLGRVVALGGGAVMTPRVAGALREFAADGGHVVWLQVDETTVAERLAGGDRPLLAGDDALARWRELAAARESTYAELATEVVDTTGRPPHEVARVVAEHVAELPDARRWPTGPRSGLRVAVTTSEGSGAYPVSIGHGVLDDLGLLLPATGAVPPSALVVHQPGLEAATERVHRALEGAGIRVHVHGIEAAEAGKQLDGVAGIWEACAAAGLDRGGLLVAVGGGAATDVTGFAAATWMRGIDVVHVPTTLLAMVDASVGGKTGINTAAGKNLVGAFHQPRAVVADLDLLAGLPVEDVRAGLAEVIKSGYIDAGDVDGGRDVLARVGEGAGISDDPRSWPFLAELVHRALSVKARAVAADTREAGVREFLNFGHTLGHALEKVEGYRMRHGDAVAIGMVFATALGEEHGLWPGTDEVRELLRAVGLPTRYEGDASWEEVRAAMAGDKKARDGALRFVVLEEICCPTTLATPSEDSLRAAWEAVTG